MYISYDASGSPMSITQGSDTYYYVTNIQGDVIAILNSSGTTVAEYVYDAWGNIFSTTGSMATTLGKYNPLRYRGYVYDEEYGLYYLQSRYYNPATGRFLNADAFATTGQDLLGSNMFAYCSNNPVLFQDANGYCRRVGPNDIKVLDCGLSSCPSSNNFTSYTVSVGVSVAVGVGPLTLGGQISVVTDATGKSELQMSYTSPNLLPWEYPSVGDMLSVIKESGFKFGGSAMFNVAVTNAPTVESLHGPAMSSGVYGPGVAVDCSVIPNAYANVPNYQGLAISSGLCTPGVSLSASDTAIAIPVNYSVYDLVRKSCNAMWGIYE